MGEPAPALLFVCTGNTCRSPLAERLAARELERLGLPWRTASAGVAARDDAPASDAAAMVAAEVGVDLRGHRARLLTRGMVLEADLVLVMEAAQQRFVRVLAPEAAERVHVLRAHATRGAGAADVLDPFGADAEAYRRARDEIHDLVRKSVQRWAEEARSRRA